MTQTPEDLSERRAKKARPPGWVAPGPRPRGSCSEPDLFPGVNEDLSYLAGDFKIFQRRDGHRWSLDDLVTAWTAERVAPHGVFSAVDLGTGIGSVMTLLAWARAESHWLGVEAQEVSVGMAKRSLRYNGIDSRCEVLLQDFRTVDWDMLVRETGPRDLVTGTPPYIREGHGIVSSKVQRGPCCFELRGGVEAYIDVAARLLSETGRFVVCAGANAVTRATEAAESAGLAIEELVEVVPREGKAPLLVVFAMKRRTPEPLTTRQTEFVVRRRDLSLAPDMVHARELFGMPPIVK